VLRNGVVYPHPGAVFEHILEAVLENGENEFTPENEQVTKK
jgi:hypothetical protein